MNRLGIESLNAGAPDIRLTGDQRPTYTQRRRDQMAYGGIAGLDGRKRYGIGSWFQEKVKDPIKEKFVDPAIDFVTENPMLTAAGIGLGVNQFGLPGGGAGQNWLGDLLGAAIPGGTQFNTVLGDKVPFTYGMPDYSNVTGVINPMNIGTNIGGITGITSSTEQDALNYAKQYGLNLLGKQLGLTPQQQQQQQQQQRQDISWKIPMAIGAGAGAYQKKYLEDQPEFGKDTTGIKFQTGAEAMADPNLRFKPKAEYADVAEGGRIGYATGGPLVKKGITEILKKFKRPIFSYDDEAKMIVDLMETGKYSQKELTKLDGDQIVEIYVREGFTPPRAIPPADETINLKNVTPKIEKAQGGRIGYAEAGDVDYVPEEEWKDPYEAAEESGLSDIFQSSFPFMKWRPKETGPSMINKIQEYKYGQPPGSLTSQGEVPERPPMSMEDTIAALEDRWDEAIEEGHDPGHGGEFDRLGIFSKEDIRKRVEQGWKFAKGQTADTGIATVAQGGRIGAQEGGLMNLGGMEKDYRQEGGFVPIGGQEKADDVPARLSKNEFVFTADAVRNAGGGDIDAGAEVMENLMEHLEAGGEVSEDSQGLEGARDMFANAQALEKRII